MSWAPRVPILLLAVLLGASVGALAHAPPAKIEKHFMPLPPTTRALALTSASNDMVWHGGEVQQTPRVFVTFWGWGAGADPNGEAAYLTRYFSGVGGSSWANIQTQYHGRIPGLPLASGDAPITNPGAQLAGVWYDNSQTTVPLDPDNNMDEEVLASVAHFGYDPQANYVIATPHGHNTAGFGSQFCAWHSVISEAGVMVPFTNLPYMTDAYCGANFVNPGPAGILDGVSIVAGHEYAETVTDPRPISGWTDASGGAGETGDKCAWVSSGPGRLQNVALSTGTFAVQGMWSNAAHGCVVSYP